METKFEQLAMEALTLTTPERAAFARLLLESLKEDAEVDEAWIREAERRIAELDEGIGSAVPMDQALAQVRSLLK